MWQRNNIAKCNIHETLKWRDRTWPSACTILTMLDINVTWPIGFVIMYNTFPTIWRHTKWLTFREVSRDFMPHVQAGLSKRILYCNGKQIGLCCIFPLGRDTHLSVYRRRDFLLRGREFKWFSTIPRVLSHTKEIALGQAGMIFHGFRRTAFVPAYIHIFPSASNSGKGQPISQSRIWWQCQTVI